MKFNLSILLVAFYAFAAFSQDNPYQNHADKLYDSGEYERAFRLYGNAIKADKPEDANYKLYINAGNCAYFLNFKQIALSYYGLSAQRNAPPEELIKNIHNFYCEDNVLCTSETLKKIVQKHPEARDRFYPEIAALLFNQSEYERAIPVLKECLIFQPQSFPTQKMLAESFFHTGNADSAYIFYKEIAELHHTDYDSFIFLGNYYFVNANKHAKISSIPEEKRTKYFFFKNKDEKKPELDITTEFYSKAGEYLEKAYSIYNSEEVRKSLIEIYTIIGDKDKTAFYKKNSKN